MPIGICECGCGNPTPTCTFTRTWLRHYVGHPLPLIPGHRPAHEGQQRDIRGLTATEAAYLAGIVDGEGCIYITPAGRRAVRVTIANTDAALMDWLRQIGGSVIRNKTQRAPRQSRKTVFSWSVSAWRTSRAVLVQIEPFMIIKRSRAQQAIRLLDGWLTHCA